MTRAMRRMRKYLVVVACIALVAGLAIGGTIAWLADSTETVTNTFAPKNIDITLTETNDGPYDLVPGETYAKNPTVNVIKAEVDTWVFVQIETSENIDTFVDYSVVTGATNGALATDTPTYWNPLTDVNGVYYCKVAAGKTANLPVLTGDNGGQVTIKNVTKTQMDNQTTDLTMEFTAYAIQAPGFDTAADAWRQIGNENWAQNGANNTDDA